MEKQNYQLTMENALRKIPEGTKLVLHSCCGPCSSSVLEQLAAHFEVTLLYYNPNIWPKEEYIRRRDEQQEVLKKLPIKHPVHFVELPYKEEEFLAVAAGLEAEPEGGSRCAACFALRLGQAAAFARRQGINWLTTTLTVSPHKNAALLNKIGEKAAEENGVHFLPSDFKKKNGYKRSLELSEEYGLYRQEYCGCEFSYARQT